ncbi:MAG TPA: hypothetical protein VHA12_04030 [Candidatus Nanoarchaeia archaeon]|nr:hypothetical protein [Candidatus Nanoarchaeia archaeon]
MISNKFNFLLSITLLIAVLSFMPLALADPNGAKVVNGTSSSAAVDSTPDGNNAIAGNVTELTISGTVTTQAWQGYFGNVSGVVRLANSAGQAMYNWTQASPQGEVYASTNSTVYWTNIQCFNFTAVGDYTSETGNGGTTSLYGTNLTQLQAQYGITAGDADTVNGTFNLIGAGTHDAFFTASQDFAEGECQSTRVYDDTGAGVANKFEEVLLYEPDSASVVFASLLEQDADGFDAGTHDFEMLVLENGHGVDVASTPYYFFVELQ